MVLQGFLACRATPVIPEPKARRGRKVSREHRGWRASQVTQVIPALRVLQVFRVLPVLLRCHPKPASQPARL